MKAIGLKHVLMIVLVLGILVGLFAYLARPDVASREAASLPTSYSPYTSQPYP